MARKLFAEIFREVAAASPEDKALILQLNNSVPLRQLLLAALDPKVTFDVEVPSYRVNEETDCFATNSLYVEYRRLYIFMDTYRNVTSQRKAVLLAQILEAIDPSDAVVLTKVIKKDLSDYGITKEIVNEAFPGLVA